MYENGLSEKAVGRVVRSRSERIYVATKCGRQINPHVNEGYQPKVLQKFVEDSLKRTGLETLDLINKHRVSVGLKALEKINHISSKSEEHDFYMIEKKAASHDGFVERANNIKKSQPKGRGHAEKREWRI